MQTYNGPKNRRLTKFTGEYGFRKDGRVNYLENREIYMTQSFEVGEKSTTNFRVPEYWYFPDEEAIVNPQIGDFIRTVEFPTFGRLCLNRTITNLRFKPDNSFNSLDIDMDCQLRLAPLLSDKTVFNNVTREPTRIESAVEANSLWDSASVQMTAYNRLWFGFIQDDEDNYEPV